MASNVQFLGVILLHLCIASSGLYFDPARRYEAHHYLRYADVNRHCQSVLSSAKELRYDASNRPDRVLHELSFEKGDWRQDAGDAPLVPFDAGDDPKEGARRLPDPMPLATFVLTHVDEEEHPSRAAVNVSGVLVLTVSRKSPGQEFAPYMSSVSPEFNLSAGQTRLKIIFEGVYTETAKGNGDNDGERVLCMLGSAVLPKRRADSVGPWDWAKNSGRSSFQPPVTADNNILLVLRYPKKLTLATRAVVGTMRSTSGASDASYFDAVQLVSGLMMLIPYSTYHYRTEELPAGVRNALPSSSADDVLSNRARDAYNGSYPCQVLNLYGARFGQVNTLLPGWQCDSTMATGAPCHRHSLGPFEMDRAADDDVLAGAGIIMQGLQCQDRQRHDMGGHGTALVSVVFRVLSPWEDWRTARWRSGLSGMTLSAEGVWNASTGQACMVACRGIAGKKACNFRVCLFFPTTMSITRLDTMLGQIAGVDAAGEVSPPLLSFRQHMSPPRLSDYYSDAGKLLVPFKYNYTKLKQAGELRQRSVSPFDLRKIVAKFLPLSYPQRGGGGDDRRSLSTLADRLTLIFMTVPGLFRQEQIEHPTLYLEVFLLDQIIPIQGHVMDTSSGSGIPIRELNVSAELIIFEDHHQAQNSVMSLEGVYNPGDGRMHLIGCRDVRLFWQNTSASRGLELQDGMDCSIEVKVEYPPTTIHWFIMSTAKIQIASTRTAADPLHFDTMKLRSRPVLYPKQQRGGFYRGVFNGVLCIVLLSATIAALLSQLRYLKSHADVAPYISMVMLGVQAAGHGIPLVTGVQAILARVTLRSPGDVAMAPYSGRSPYYRYDSGRQLCESIDQAVKVLALFAFVLTLRLGQKVRRSRVRMVERSPLDLARVPSDGRVFVYHFGLHLVLFVLVLALNREAMTVEQQVALMQDLFLLPQVIGNAVWRVNCRPLKGSFYVGVTAVRLLPHVYDYVRPPAIFLEHYSSEQQFVNAHGQGRFFSKAGDVVIPLAAVALALMVHAQQRWNYAIVSRMGKTEQKKLHHMF